MKGEATIVFTAVDLHGKKNSSSKRLLLTNPNSAFSYYPWTPCFLPFSTTAAGGINSLTASQEGQCSFLTTVNRIGQCSQSSSTTLHLNSCFNFCNAFFPHSSLPPHPLHPSIPHTNSCKLTIWGKPFSTPHHTHWKSLGFVLEGMLWSKKFPSQKDWDGHFGFWNLLWSGTFPLQKGHAFWFSKCVTSFFFLWYSLGISREKKKKKKNPLMVLYAG